MTPIESVTSLVRAMAPTRRGAFLARLQPKLRGAVIAALRLPSVVGAAPLPMVRASIASAGNPPARGFVAKQSPATGRLYTSLKFSQVKYGDHKTTIQNARVAGQRALDTAKRIQAALAQAPTKSPLLTKITADLAKTGKAAFAQADAHLARVTAEAQKRTANQAAMKAKMAAATKTGATTAVHGRPLPVVVGAQFGYDLLGVYAPNPNDPPNPSTPGYLRSSAPDPGYQPNPAAPGYLMNGMPDPTFTGAAAANPADPTGEITALGSPPTLASVMSDYAQTAQPDPYPTGNDNQTFHGLSDDSGLPPGAIVYDGSHGNNVNAFGSWSAFFGPGAKNFQGGTGYFYGKQGWISIHGGTQAAMTNFAGGGVGSDILKAVNAKSLSMSLKDGTPYGPLIGNPKNPNGGIEWANNLRFNADSGNFFWFFDKAPAWASGPIYQTMLSQAATQYAASVATAKTDNANAAAQDLLTQQQAAQVQAQQTIADQQYQAAAEQQQNQLSLQSQAQAAQEQQFEQQYFQTQATQEQQAQAAQLAYYQQNPSSAPWAQPQGDDGSSYGGDDLTDAASDDQSAMDSADAALDREDLVGAAGGRSRRRRRRSR